MTNVSFISGTRADYGKIKPYIDFLTTHTDKNVSVFITGMNVLKKYGSTCKFIKKDLKKTTKADIRQFNESLDRYQDKTKARILSTLTSFFRFMVLSSPDFPQRHHRNLRTVKQPEGRA